MVHPLVRPAAFYTAARNCKQSFETMSWLRVTPLEGLSGLQWLDLDGTEVTNLTPLAGLSGLRSLDIRTTNVTDVSPVEHLKDLKIEGP